MSRLLEGWIAVAASAVLPRGTVRPARVLGRDLVVYRGGDGVARLRDAHCPHLGAHLGHGGVVVGDGLRCPFHGWCFGGDGRCVSVPGARKIPPRAALEALPAREAAGLVWWWPGEGIPDGEPPSADWLAPSAETFAARVPLARALELLGPGVARQGPACVRLPDVLVALTPVDDSTTILHIVEPRGGRVAAALRQELAGWRAS